MNTKCSVYKVADIIGKRWTLLILLEISKRGGVRRYSELKNSIPGITGKMLSARLKELEVQKMIKNKVDPSVVPVKSEYRLTDSGKDFLKIIKDIKEWSLRWKVKNKTCENQDCKHCEF